MPDATFDRPDLTTFCRLDELGLEAVGQRLEPGRAVLICRVVESDRYPRSRRSTEGMDGSAGICKAEPADGYHSLEQTRQQHRHETE